jgi:hypothetical protein
MPITEEIQSRLFYSPAETERLLGISHATCYRLIAAGRLDARKLGGKNPCKQPINRTAYCRAAEGRAADIRAAITGRETELLDALNIRRRDGKPHIACPYRDHADDHPSWRWDERKRKAFCTCGARDVLGVLMGVEGIDFEAAKIRAAEFLKRPDLIRERRARRRKGEGATYLPNNAATLQHLPGAGSLSTPRSNGCGSNSCWRTVCVKSVMSGRRRSASLISVTTAAIQLFGSASRSTVPITLGGERDRALASMACTSCPRCARPASSC